MKLRDNLRKHIHDADYCIHIIGNLDPNTINIDDTISLLRICEMRPRDILAHLAFEAENWFRANHLIIRKRFCDNVPS